MSWKVDWGRFLPFRSLDVENDYLVGFAAGLASPDLYHSLEFKSMILADGAVNEVASRNCFFLIDRLHR